MIRVIDNKLQAELLSDDNTLSEKTIKNYDYIEFKNYFEEIVDILSTNLLVHSLYQEVLKYHITEDLEFIIAVDDNIRDRTIVYSYENDYAYVSDQDTSIFTLDRASYDASIELCLALLKKVKLSFDRLNEVEKFIIKSLEFDEIILTDEELMDRLMKYKNRYYLCKKSAYIKMVLQLNIKELKKWTSGSLIESVLANYCKEMVSKR